jgi:hypothetical protein
MLGALDAIYGRLVLGCGKRWHRVHQRRLVVTARVLDATRQGVVQVGHCPGKRAALEAVHRVHV